MSEDDLHQINKMVSPQRVSISHLRDGNKDALCITTGSDKLVIGEIMLT